jgi:hypothetical protein
LEPLVQQEELLLQGELQQLEGELKLRELKYGETQVVAH